MKVPEEKKYWLQRNTMFYKNYLQKSNSVFVHHLSLLFHHLRFLVYWFLSHWFWYSFGNRHVLEQGLRSKEFDLRVCHCKFFRALLFGNFLVFLKVFSEWDFDEFFRLEYNSL